MREHIKNLKSAIGIFFISYIFLIVTDFILTLFDGQFIIYFVHESIRYIWIFFLFFMIPYRIIDYFLKEGLVLNLANAQIVTAILLYIAMLPIENMAYYTFIRILVTVLSLSIVYNLYYNKKGNTIPLYSLVFIGFAILYNPIVPFYFDKETWIGINNVTSIAMVAKSVFYDFKVEYDI